MTDEHTACKPPRLLQELQSTLSVEREHHSDDETELAKKKNWDVALSTFHTLYFIKMWLPPACKAIVSRSHQIILVNDTWIASASYYSPYLYFITSNFSRPLQQWSQFLQQARLLVFIMHHLFLDKGPILLSAKAKCRAQVNCFKEICIMLSDGASILGWIFSRHGCLSYQRKEKRTSVEKNGLSKEGTELSC